MPKKGIIPIPAVDVVVRPVSRSWPSLASADTLDVQIRVVITLAVMNAEVFMMSPDRFLVSIIV
jgi:hypothetical protein